MLKQAIFRTGVKFGVISGVAGFALVLLLYFAGLNPYGQYAMFGWIFIPVAVFWGLSYFKRYNEQKLSFGKALLVGFFIAFYAALCSAMLLYVFSAITGYGPIERHINEMKLVLESTREAALKDQVLNERAYQQTYNELEKTTAGMLAADDFLKRLFVGLISALIGAVFFRREYKTVS